ncbi:MAG: hypothetical protein J7484_00960 [Microbacterium sp.]|nr:hypothetical protein [Microbacterium sp.]
MGTNRGVLVSAAATASAILTLSLCGCLSTNSTEAALRSGLSDKVGAAQDALWETRQDVVMDLDAALAVPLATLSSTTVDARALPDDASVDIGSGQWLMLDAVEVDEGMQLTLATATSTPTSSGWWSSGSDWTDAYTCFTVTVTLTSLETSPSDCGDAREKAARLLSVAAEDGFMSLDEIAYHSHVDALDHPCQCYSGSPCECPGG